VSIMATNKLILIERPWLKGSVELLEHAVSHYKKGSPSDLRFAMIHIDNSIELAGRLYLKMDVRLQDSLSPSEAKEFERHFDKLMKHLSIHLTMDNITRGSIEYFHEIRNNLYHNGSGISVDPDIVNTYIATASRLLYQMFNLKLGLGETDSDEQIVNSIADNSKKIESELPPAKAVMQKVTRMSIQLINKFEDLVSKRYQLEGYHVIKERPIKIYDHYLKFDLVCEKDQKYIFVEVKRDLSKLNFSILNELKHRKDSISSINVPAIQSKILRLHLETLSAKRQRESQFIDLGWEIENWDDTSKILAKYGLQHEVEQFNKFREEYHAFVG
jgi:hypothetical protein